MILDNFRRKLRQESQIWRDEGIISSAQHQEISNRYQLHQIETATKDSSTFMAIALGGLLLALGVITFVAANWQTWSREVKFILLMSLFLSTAITGFYTWRQPLLAKTEGKKPQPGKRLLGEALLILSSLILGATLMLMAQTFNISGSTSELFLAWGFGVLAMAYSLSLTSLGVIAIILMQIGYWMGIGELTATSEVTWARLAVEHMSLLSWLLFVPLAYICRSRWIFGLGAVAFTICLQYSLNPLPLVNFAGNVSWVASLALGLSPGLLWSYDDLLFPSINYRVFKPLARKLALTCFSVIFYLLSFRWEWQPGDDTNNFLGSSTLESSANVFQSLPIIDIGILSGLAVVQWLFLLRHRTNSPRRVPFFTISVIITFLSFIVIIPFWHQAISRITELGVFTFNILLGMLAWGLMQEGIKLNSRSNFWSGLLLLTLQIMSRVLEYDTGLLFKSLVFILCGSGLLFGGLWFERRTSSKPSNLSNNPGGNNNPNNPGGNNNPSGNNNPGGNNNPSANKPSSNNPGGNNNPSSNKSAGDRSAGDRSAGDRSAGDRSAGDRSAGDRSAGDKPPNNRNYFND